MARRFRVHLLGTDLVVNKEGHTEMVQTDRRHHTWDIDLDAYPFDEDVRSEDEIVGWYRDNGYEVEAVDE